MSEPTPARVNAQLLEKSRNLATPFTRAWYWSWLVMGAVQIVGGLIEEWSPSLALADLPDWVAFLIGILCTGGAVLLLVGAHRRQALTVSWAVERLGAYVSIGGWASYAIAGIWANPARPMAWLFGLASAVALTARVSVLNSREQVTRHIVEGQR